MINLQQGWQLTKQSASDWVEDYAPSMGAALSYYTLFSMAPVLLIAISVAGLVFGAEAARGEIFAQLQGMLGQQGAAAIQSALQSVNKPAQGLLSSIIGIVVLLVGATTVFAELQEDLDRIWRAPARERSSGIWGLLRSRLLSFGMILGIGFLLMVSLVLSAAFAALSKWWAPVFGAWSIVAMVFNFVVGFAMTTVLFALIYKFMPRVHIRWPDVWIGALVTALLFTIGKSLIGLYIGRSSVASGFGAAGSLVVVLLWVYYSAQIFLFGAEFTAVYARTFGSLKNRAAEQGQAAPSKGPQGKGEKGEGSPGEGAPGEGGQRKHGKLANVLNAVKDLEHGHLPGAAGRPVHPASSGDALTAAPEARAAAHAVAQPAASAAALAPSRPAAGATGPALRRAVPQWPAVAVTAACAGGFALGSMVRGAWRRQRR